MHKKGRNGVSKEWHKEFVKVVGVNIWAPEWYQDSIRNFDAEKMADLLVQSRADVGFGRHSAKP